ncbi:tRNA (adenosine(37)-N6)-dimethylallyltransferase MiaA [Agaribacterium haliotis]|uniref:tRNA (adenosine(37)-N6)-dimethylallyltransferase MiaA n=1 Tax=Agaribacterium haliotis TaxID=2013869 RepID=UPI000BB556DD|nr:tRNA (adenosine(37)-N6)-dimethylallyltransferase MiaA [Agaribacterium haliotis]
MSHAPILALLGPTASGKTALAVALAKALDGEIISVDSALVYRGLNIGAAKPSDDEKQGIAHHLIDIRDPAQHYSAADFSRDAQAAIDAIRARGKLPILAGGTMLYFKALLQGMNAMPEANLEIREQIEKEAQQLGWPAMHKQLAEVDAKTAAKLHPNHSQRISRALEVWRSSGKSMSQWQQGETQGLLKREAVVQMAIAPRDRSVLHERINLRLENMFAQGLIAEVEALHRREDLNVELPSMRSVGYRQVWLYLDKLYDYETMRHKALVATRQLAKRQLTWLRSWPDLHWLDTMTKEGALCTFDEIVRRSLSIYDKSTL